MPLKNYVYLPHCALASSNPKPSDVALALTLTCGPMQLLLIRQIGL